MKRLSTVKRTVLISFISLVAVVSATAQPAQRGPAQSVGRQEGRPRALENVGIDQRLNEQVPLDIVLKDESGKAVQLKDYFRGKPVVLALVYYSCPMLCNQVLDGLASSLDVLKFDIGKEFDVVTVSFDARDTADMARSKKDSYVGRYKREGAEQGWHFFTGDQASIDRLTRAVGFNYAWDEETNQFAHASGVMILTPEGKLARYFYGIEYAPKEMRLGLIEAADNKIGTAVDQVLLYCFHYDPATGKYGPVVMNMVRLGGGLTLIAIAILFFVTLRKGSRHSSVSAGGTA
ncbi:MAG TPA: SCO family protein [Blastocatellia bacterium]|nr:SCO family protein [Blastocatellia bacterium]